MPSAGTGIGIENYNVLYGRMIREIVDAGRSSIH